MKKISIAILIFAFVLSVLFAGLGRNTEISDFNVVSGFAIDKSSEKWQVTASVILPSKEDPYGSKSKSVKGEGLTLKEAFENVSINSDKKLYTDSVRIYVISESLGEEKEVLDYFLTSVINMRAVTVYCKGRAEALFKTDGDNSVILADKIKRYCFEIKKPVPKVINFLKQNQYVYLTENGHPERSETA